MPADDKNQWNDDPGVLTKLGSNLRERREQLGLAIEDVAGRADLEPDRYARIEAGTVDPAILTLLALSGALQTSMEDLAADLPAWPPRDEPLRDR